MENTNQYDELIAKYLLNELNMEEKRLVEKWIQESKENRKYFEECSRVLRLTTITQTSDKVNVEEEWKHFVVTAGLNQVQPAGDQQDVLKNADETTRRKGIIYRIIISTSVAASILLIIGLAWQFVVTRKEAEPVVITTEKTVAGEDVIALVRNEINNSANPKTVRLQDGSVIILSAGSSVSFQEPFVGNKRDITLIGSAEFSVAADKTKPFTVFSQDISTTALGTQFSVTASEASHSITVKLYEGKVVVKSVAIATRKLEKEICLLPGQQMVYNNVNATAIVSSFKVNKQNDLRQKDSRDEIINGEAAEATGNSSYDKTPWYMFNNQSLTVVFKQLSEMYQVEIVFSKKDVRNMYFIGKFNKADSLENILKQISTLNNLKLKKDGKKFIIKK